ncbi:MAG: hypothetical protein HC857_14535 [Synechococcales cyanobacterium RU_4_20]|nr:hypothetical protein [Synechococcales cyanobacterium RU_4_20]
MLWLVAAHGPLQKSVTALVNLGLPASGAGVTLHFLIAGQMAPALASGLTTVGVAFITLGRRFGARLWERLGTRFDQEAETLADWLFDHAKIFGQRAWWVVSGNFRAQYNACLIYRYRDYRTQGLKTRGPLPSTSKNCLCRCAYGPRASAKCPPS